MNLDARLARLETRVEEQHVPAQPWRRLVADTAAESDAKIQQLMDSGEASHGDRFIVRMIVDPPRRTA